MRTTRNVSAIAGSVLLALSLVGCSEAEKAADDAKGKAADAADSASAKAGEKGKKAADDAKKKLGDKAKGKKSGDDAKAGADAKGDKSKGKKGAGAAGEEGSGDASGSTAGGDGVTVELGDFSGDKDAKAAATFFQARYAALASDGAETGDLKAATTPKHFKKASAFVKKNAGKQKPTTVTVVGVESGSVDVCAGPKGTNARTIAVEGGKVADNTKGDHTCK